MKTIVCYGDSNTYGYNPENGFRYEYEDDGQPFCKRN